MGILYKGQDTDFDDIPWESLTEEEYIQLVPLIKNPILERKAQVKRGIKGGFAKQPVTARVTPKTIDDPLAHFNPNDALFPDSVTKFGFEWWCNYFYQECSNLDKKKFYQRVWGLNKSLRDRYSSKVKPPEWVEWRVLLEDMLKAGFDVFPDNFKKVDDVLFPALEKHDLLRLGFRGELRQPLQVKAHNGCVPKASLLALRKSMGMGSPWHPFYDETLRNKVYYRKGNGDNCLYTTVSVAYDFDTASKFPLLDDLHKDAPDAIGTATVLATGIQSSVAAMREKLGAQITQQRLKNPNAAPPVNAPAKPGEAARLLKSVRMSVYLFRVRGNTYDTQAYQASKNNAEFPERAMEAVPWGDFLARVMIDRIHYGETSNEGHVNVIHGYEFLHPEDEIKRLLGGGAGAVDGLAKLKTYLAGICERGKLKPDGTTDYAFTTANTSKDIKITKILRIEPRTDWGLNPAKTYTKRERNYGGPSLRG